MKYVSIRHPCWRCHSPAQPSRAWLGKRVESVHWAHLKFSSHASHSLIQSETKQSCTALEGGQRLSLIILKKLLLYYFISKSATQRCRLQHSHTQDFPFCDGTWKSLQPIHITSPSDSWQLLQSVMRFPHTETGTHTNDNWNLTINWILVVLMGE